MNVSAIILAGGKSTRMHYNKEYIKVQTEYLVHTQIKKLKQHFEEVIVVSNNIEHYTDFDVKVVQDILHGQSPLIGLHAGLIHSKNKYNYVIACDMPEFSHEYVSWLINRISHDEAYVATNNGYIEPFHAIYSKSITTKIEDYVISKQYGLQRFIMTLNHIKLIEEEINRFNPKKLFRNINNERDLIAHSNPFAPITQSFQIHKYKDGSNFEVEDTVITEFPLQLFINDKLHSLIMITPNDIELMVTGYLYTQMLITSLEEIRSIDIQLEQKQCFVSLTTAVENHHQHRIDILSSACTNSQIDLDTVELPVVSNSFIFDQKEILSHAQTFNTQSTLFIDTGGVHSVSFHYDDSSILFEDIGRHNAMDKVVGFILKNKLDTDNMYVFTSGRISSDIVMKAALINIPLIISRSAPTALSIKLASALQITLIGFARGNRFNVYTGIDKIKMTS